MAEVERQMRYAMRETLRFALEAAALQAFEAWLLAWPAQCIITGATIVWCQEVHNIYRVS